MFRIVIAAAACLAALGAHAEEWNLSVELQNVERQGAFVNTMFKVDNVGDVDYRVVFVQCTFFDRDKRALESAMRSIDRVQSGSTNYGKVTILRKLNDIKFAECKAITAART